MPKVILLKDVEGLGYAGDVVEPKGGYARNYLIPQGLAMIWTKGAQKSMESLRVTREDRRKEEISSAKTIAQALKDQAIKVSVKAGETGKLFGSVGSSDLVKAATAAGISGLDKKKIEILDSIKETGTYKAKVRLHDEVDSEFEFTVAAHEAE